MTTESKVTTPKNGDRVSAAQREGIFEVVGVNSLMQKANIRSIDGTGSVIPNVPWTMLTSVTRK
jgi:hypothetical protein